MHYSHSGLNFVVIKKQITKEGTCTVCMMELGNVVILLFSAQSAEMCNENTFLKFPLCYLDSLASLMTNGSKEAFALGTDFIKWILMSEDSTLNCHGWCVCFFFFFHCCLLGVFFCKTCLDELVDCYLEAHWLLLLILLT